MSALLARPTRKTGLVRRHVYAKAACPEPCQYRSDLDCCQGPNEKACVCMEEPKMIRTKNPIWPYWGYPYAGYPWGLGGYGYPWGWGGYPYWGWGGYGYGYPWGWGGYPYWGWGGYHHPHGHGGTVKAVHAKFATGSGSTPVGSGGSTPVPNPKPDLRKRLRRWFRKHF
jgi:hypothetical protein